MSTVYVLVAGWDHEGSSPIRAFDDRYEGEAAAHICLEHKAGKPAWPNSDDDEEAIEAWSKADEEWRNASPAGYDNADADYFTIIEVPLVAKAPE